MAVCLQPLAMFTFGKQSLGNSTTFPGRGSQKSQDGLTVRHDFLLSLLCTCWNVLMRLQTLQRKVCD